jgi:short-subunit dehydrogenase
MPEQPTKRALITGSSTGIGLELARLFAKDGYDLVIAADEAEILKAAKELSSYGVSVRPLEVDLRTADGVAELYHTATDDGRPVDVAALNAGVGRAGPFVKGELDDDLAIVDLNVRSTVHLAKLVLRDMADRGAGRVLFTSSIASTMPGSNQAVYNASKSFVQSFAEAVRDEMRDSGVTVTSLMPGPTDTKFFARGGMEDTPQARIHRDDPAKVARQGFDALMRDQQKVVAESLMSKAMGVMNKFTPDAIKVRANRLIATPTSRK